MALTVYQCFLGATQRFRHGLYFGPQRRRDALPKGWRFEKILAKFGFFLRVSHGVVKLRCSKSSRDQQESDFNQDFKGVRFFPKKINYCILEILSPHYRALRDGNMITIPANYLPKDYVAPGFRVKKIKKGQFCRIDKNRPPSGIISSKPDRGQVLAVRVP
ncbi:MAG: hypothetical protein IT260_09620 [Saprospiraceae bacterium]|nr:hypothetical protein [Saprospiraceae bacterium]